MRPLFLAVMVAVAGCGAGGSADTAGTTVASVEGEPATVVTVTDGDTLTVRIAGAEIEVRLEGINAPEHGECFAVRSRDLLVTAVGTDLIVVPSTPGQDQYGRMLAYVYADDLNLNRWMLQQGAALATSGDHELLAEFLADDEDSYSRGVGMWARGVCRPDPDPGVFLYEVQPDAPGRDDVNPNGEIVVVGNRGAAADLTGWVLRDDSSVHRHRFPIGSTLDSGALLVIHSGCGSDTPNEVHWCADGAVWNNEGDTALLLDAAGRVVDRWRYGPET